MFSALLRNFRFACRGLKRAPGFTLAFVITLGLGIGANTAIFSVPEIIELRDGVPSFEGVAEFSALTFTMLGFDEPRRVRSGIVTGNYFEVMGFDAAVGRVIGSGDDGEMADPVMVLTHEYWRTTFGGDPGVVAVALSSWLPLAGAPEGLSALLANFDFAIGGFTPELGTQPRADHRVITPGYFDTLGIRLVQGRGFDATDGPDSAPVVMINEALARRYFADRDPVGQRIRWTAGCTTWMKVGGTSARWSPADRGAALQSEGSDLWRNADLSFSTSCSRRSRRSIVSSGSNSRSAGGAARGGGGASLSGSSTPTRCPQRASFCPGLRSSNTTTGSGGPARSARAPSAAGAELNSCSRAVRVRTSPAV